jgi:uncharacterized protein YndB with AHSA1/START domain
MENHMAPTTDTADRELVMTRTINAPRELVFAAWTDPEHIGQWWGPNGFTTTTAKIDIAVGGQWRFMMHGPDGTDYPNVITYTEIVKPERIRYELGDDTNEHMFSATVTLEADGDKTVLTMRMLCSSREQLEGIKKFGAAEGGQQTLARLERYLTTGK